MTHRDLAWRGIGLALFAAACVKGVTGPVGGLGGLLCFVLAIVGAVLMIQGKRVPMALRIERSPHRNLPAAIRARHHRRAPIEGERA